MGRHLVGSRARSWLWSWWGTVCTLSWWWWSGVISPSWLSWWWGSTSSPWSSSPALYPPWGVGFVVTVVMVVMAGRLAVGSVVTVVVVVAVAES